MRIRIVWAFLILFFTASYSQNGSFKGRVFNEKTNVLNHVVGTSFTNCSFAIK